AKVLGTRLARTATTLGAEDVIWSNSGVLVALPVLTESIVHLALVRIGQHLVGLVEILEALFGPGIVAIDVRVHFLGTLAECGLDRLFVRVACHTEYLIVVLEIHSTLLSHSSLPRISPPIVYKLSRYDATLGGFENWRLCDY